MKKTGMPIKLAVIGHPIKHSLSPNMHGAALRHLKISGSYLAIDVAPENLENFFTAFRQGLLNGINVTVPHKTAAFKAVDILSPSALRMGAVNTIVRRGKKLHGYNTDGAGYLKSLVEMTSFRPQGKNILLIGSGGAALAIADVLAEKKISRLMIFNRTMKNAHRLSRRIKKNFPKTHVTVCDSFPDSKKMQTFDLCINTTTLGMAGQPWPDLDFLDSLHKKCIVSDIVYQPRKTELLIRAQKHRLIIHEGYGMLLHQGALAFEKFTKNKAPLPVMRQALLRAMGKR